MEKECHKPFFLMIIKSIVDYTRFFLLMKALKNIVTGCFFSNMVDDVTNSNKTNHIH